MEDTIKKINKFRLQFRKNNSEFLKQKNIKNLNQLEWKNVINANTPEEITFLQDYNAFRKSCVDTLLYEIVSYYECGIINAGSADVTSDYDITIDCLGKSAKIVETFNDIFEHIWGKSSAEIFDTNIYGIGYFFNKKKYFTKTLKSDIFIKKNNVYMINITNEKEIKKDSQNQYKWATLLVYKYFYDLSAENKKEFLNNFTFRNIDNVEKSFLELIKNVDYYDITSLNDKYKSELDILEKMIFKNENVKKMFSKKEIKNQIAKTMFYGNETYFTQGSFFHVVGNIQGKKNINLSNEEYLHSMIENFGYLLMELESSENYYQFISLSSKYLIRINNALNSINSKLHIEIDDDLGEIKKYRRSSLVTKEQEKLTKKVLHNYKFSYEPEDYIQESKMVFLRDIIKLINKSVDFPIKIKKL